jgi:hypothetical protein
MADQQAAADARKKKIRQAAAQIPRPPAPAGATARDIAALAAGQNRDVILARINARNRGKQSRQRYGGRD